MAGQRQRDHTWNVLKIYILLFSHKHCNSRTMCLNTTTPATQKLLYCVLSILKSLQPRNQRSIVKKLDYRGYKQRYKVQPSYKNKCCRCTCLHTTDTVNLYASDVSNQHFYNTGHIMFWSHLYELTLMSGGDWGGMIAMVRQHETTGFFFFKEIGILGLMNHN